MNIIKKRAEFVALSKANKVHKSHFIVQFRENNMDFVRFGFTVTKKCGNAVKRNRIKRKLREAVRLQLPENHKDYVIIARDSALNAPFLTLKQEMQQAFEKADNVDKISR